METMADPDTIAGSKVPIVLMMGFRAIRNGYFKINFHSLTPFARAVITYSFSNSSKSKLLYILIIPAVPAVPITITGTGKCFNKSKNFGKLHSTRRYSGENKPPGEK